MAEPVLQLFNIPAFVNQYGGAAMPQLVQGYFRPAKGFRGFFEQGCNVVGVIRLPVFPCEYVATAVFIA